MKKLTLIFVGVALLATAAIAQVKKHTSKETTPNSGATKIVTSDGHVNLQDASLRKKHMAKKAIKHVGVKPVAGDPALKRK